jgi:hypothetical protein
MATAVDKIMTLPKEQIARRYANLKGRLANAGDKTTKLTEMVVPVAAEAAGGAMAGALAAYQPYLPGIKQVRSDVVLGMAATGAAAAIVTFGRPRKDSEAMLNVLARTGGGLLAVASARTVMKLIAKEAQKKGAPVGNPTI